ncbi:hypothetical protein M2457_003578 [Parabacteroides sp. PF5-13]|uniref:hypothetical protein n=1 Tax=unclassified Parabacteroides TaxID=2649774 RepID=UPI0024754538|nr:MULTISPECIES: hypothetical protein [unclassified Parabacteroides]MDH6317815.1 hypothetical protein [Parabacteroides sp. PF5-13]MDH6378479.1 hypothetical protein [Parabacteroides sp. PH5-33]
MKESRTVDMNKLRMTGFECFATFVIRCAKHPRRVRPAIGDKSFVSELYFTDEFPNRTSAA